MENKYTPPKLSATLACLLVALAASTTTTAHTILYDTYIQELPGYEVLQGIPARHSVVLNYSIIHVQGPQFNNSNLIDHYAVGFASHNDLGEDTDYIFGPTLRVKRGQTMYHTVINSIDKSVHSAPGDLSRTKKIMNVTGDNGFNFAMNVNLHTHGIYGSPGQLKMPNPNEPSLLQFAPGTYTGGDNIFIYVPAIQTNASLPVHSVVYRNTIPIDHMPGFHWVHGHSAGMVALSGPTANAVWLVEDGDDLDQILADSNGCKAVRTLLESSPELILHMATTDFALPPDLIGTKYENLSMEALIKATIYDDDLLYDFLDAPNQQFLNEASFPTKFRLMTANYTIPGGKDIILLNGGYLPRIRMPIGEWQRWRMINVAIQYAMAVNILQNTTTGDAAPCDMALYAKDGVYPIQIPRTVDMLYFSPASRVELLIRCNGTVGQNYTMASGMGKPVGGLMGCPPNNPNCKYMQQPIGTIELVAPSNNNTLSPPVQLIDEECTPLRPDYAADMRDSALRASGADKKLVKQDVSMTDLSLFGCNINNKFYNVNENPFTLELGTISEINLQYTDAHAFHIHIQPYQLISLPNSSLEQNSSYTNFFKPGDFHDTLYMRQIENGKNVTIRMNPGGARYSGYSVMHCHLVAHEDTGCMSVVKLQCPGYENSTAQPEICDVSSAINGTWSASRTARESASSESAPLLPDDASSVSSGGVSRSRLVVHDCGGLMTIVVLVMISIFMMN